MNDFIKKDLKEKIKKSYPGKKGKVVRDTFYEALENENACTILANAIYGLEDSLDNDTNFLAKAIAAYVRLGMEDFHTTHLSDKQMRELNPIIRNSIYTFLKDYNDNKIFKISGILRLNLPDYWEDCVYDKKM